MIRHYSEDDLDRLLDVWYRASRVGHSFPNDEFFDSERRQIAEKWLPESETSVYVVDGHVAGFISLIGNEVGGLFVDPGHQRRGIGGALMDDARRRRDIPELDVFESNTIGRSFYETYGFEVVGGHVNEVTGHPELRLRLA